MTNATRDFLKQYGKAIGAQAVTGDKLAQTIMYYYDMVYHSPSDQCAVMLLELACEQWQRREKETSHD